MYTVMVLFCVIHTMVGLFCGVLKGSSGLEHWSVRKAGASAEMVFIHLAVWVWGFFALLFPPAL